MAEPTLSVVVPAYQAAATIGEALESALTQVPAPHEVIVSDDGSTDDLDAALAPFVDRLVVVRGPNAGLATARNRAAAAASGTFLALLDADDVWLPGRTAGIVDLATRQPELDIIVTDAVMVRGNVREEQTYYEERGWPDGDQVDAILRSNFVFGASAIRRAAFEAVGGYDAGRRYAEDWDLWLRMIVGGSRAGLVRQPLYEYRRRPDSLTYQRVDLALGVIDALSRVDRSSLSRSQRRTLQATIGEWRMRAATSANATLDARRAGLALRAAIAPGVGATDRVRAALRPLRTEAWRVADRIDPAALSLRGAHPAGVALACVYRARNADVVRSLLRPLGSDVAVRLWSLDDVPVDLADRTVGAGPGTRFELLNRLVAQIPAEARAGALVLCDDDVEMAAGTLAGLVSVGRSLGLDVFQPAHSRTSFMSDSTRRLVRKQRLAVGRVTRFVEQGPVVVLSASAQRALLPLPEDMGMGWGIEARWASAAATEGLTLGIVDAVAIRHLAPPAGSYDTAEEEERLARELRAAGVERLSDLQTVVRTTGVGALLTRARRAAR